VLHSACDGQSLVHGLDEMRTVQRSSSALPFSCEPATRTVP
jgi:hypothetical protein